MSQKDYDLKHKMKKTQWISTGKKNRAATMRRQVLPGSRAGEMSPKC